MAHAYDDSIVPFTACSCQLFLFATTDIIHFLGIAVCRRIVDDNCAIFLNIAVYWLQLAPHTIQSIATPSVVLAQMVALAVRTGMLRLEHRDACT